MLHIRAKSVCERSVSGNEWIKYRLGVDRPLAKASYQRIHPEILPSYFRKRLKKDPPTLKIRFLHVAEM
jgi:hypothetical protein